YVWTGSCGVSDLEKGRRDATGLPAVRRPVAGCLESGQNLPGRSNSRGQCGAAPALVVCPRRLVHQPGKSQSGMAGIRNDCAEETKLEGARCRREGLV